LCKLWVISIFVTEDKENCAMNFNHTYYY
jgi:hypothetical protein